MTEVKLTQEEVDLINTIKTEYLNKINEFGQLKLSKISIKQQWDSLNAKEDQLEKEVIEIQNREKLICSNLEKKYGIGILNLETGILSKD